MKKRIRINYIFWKEGPLLPRLLTANRNPHNTVENDI